MNVEDYKIAMKLLRKITDNLYDLSDNHSVDYNDIERTVKLTERVEKILTNNIYSSKHTSIKTKRNNNDELKIYAKIYATFDKEVVEFINNNIISEMGKMDIAKTIRELNSAYNMAKRYIELLENPSTTNKLEELYKKNKTRINNSIF